ncbi:MAG: lysine--tRNA ligase, partial [Clostridia bacterium]|nr:lysine--tRNA ligase [Clostridia bacterium]
MSDINVNVPEAEEQDLNEVVRIRRAKLKELVDAGKDPFQKVRFDFDTYSVQIKEDFENYENKDVVIAGRIMSRRDMGKANFIDVADGKGRIQCYIKIDEVGEEVFEQYKKWDIGDIVGIHGFAFRTRRGEISVHVKEIELLAKSLLPLPEKFHGL